MAASVDFVFLLFLSLFLSILSAISASNYQSGTVYITKDKQAKFVPGKLDKVNGAAYGIYNDTLSTTGWGVLDIKAGYATADIDNNLLMYAAGYLEGVLTNKRIYQHYQNVYNTMVGNISPELKKKTVDFYAEQEKWAWYMIDKMTPDDPFWRHVGYVMNQESGLYDGYTFASHNSNMTLDKFAIQFLNGVGDYIDIRHVLNPAGRPNWRNMTHKDALRMVNSNGHCSALIKVTGAYENIFMSHSSWFLYAATMRIYKHYDFNLKDSYTVAKTMSFSSYPGFIESLDDFYLLGSQMVMIQTTNNMFNNDLYETVKPTTLLSWQRVRVAHFMANDGRQWGNYFSMFNSGTYNNQYMIVDLKKIKLGETIMDGALYVVEQIPTLVVYRDETKILREGHWPSYNVPFFETVYNMSGYPEFVKMHGLDSSYQLAPRAKIFRRDAGAVRDMESMKKIMRYNDYENDPYSGKNPCNTICCRADLDPEKPRADGCYDTKVSDYKMALNRESFAINGPTRGNKLEPFSWTAKFKDSHLGLPHTYDFDFVEMKPIL
ncbi:phospholipase B-like 1 [Tubulanus polymorphus]|uniref:phospholipase B-like 1 n=1 Tax=Tubulanus polymorphus TaxID=672921 RepID=UPI003DA4C34A